MRAAHLATLLTLATPAGALQIASSFEQLPGGALPPNFFVPKPDGSAFPSGRFSVKTLRALTMVTSTSEHPGFNFDYELYLSGDPQLGPRTLSDPVFGYNDRTPV